MQSGQIVASKYRLNQPIGAGGMASVWSATNVFTERSLAIKFMHPSVSTTPEAAHRFLMEAKASARINHPNIIDVLDVGQSEDGGFFLVMELLQGVSLETAMRRQTPPMLASEFVGVMIDVARALAAAHKAGVVHRDLKPTNVFLHMVRESVAVPKLLDFGVSKFLEEEQNNALTVAGTVLGSPFYMSPEQAMGASDLDGRTDVFAFGAILFEALSGFRPYDAPNFNALIVTIATKQPRSIDESAATMPESLRAIVKDCLATSREKRIQTFDEVVDRLLAALPELEESGVRLPPPQTVDPEATRALPVVRQSDRPPPAASGGVHLSQPPAFSSANGPGAFSAPWNGERNAITISRPPRVAILAGAIAGAGVLALLFIILSQRGREGQDSRSSATGTVAAAPVRAAPHSSSAEPPVIEVDELPVAATPTGHGTGRVSIASTPGWCNLAIDGVSHGATPAAGFDLPAGAHQLVCVPPNGKPQRMTVQIVEGTMNRFKFNLD
jgi:serine/threonine protein kinase